MKTYEDIVKLLSNPDMLTDGLAALDEYNQALTTERDTLKAEQGKQNERIKKLQEDKIDLFLKVTGRQPNEPDEEDSRNDYEKLQDKLKEERGKENGDNN